MSASAACTACSFFQVWSCLTQSRMCSEETMATTGRRMMSMASMDTGKVKWLVAKLGTAAALKKYEVKVK